MPRATKKNANQHNNRHENGIVAPGKRITKQKSNGHLNGSPNGRSTPPLPPPSTQSSSYAPDTGANGPSLAVNSLPNGDVNSSDLDQMRRKDGPEGLELHHNGSYHTLPTQEQHHRKIDVNATRNPTVHESSAMHLTLTILRLCPLRDTLAILMVLLSLSPTVVTVINTLFAMLTFTLPSGFSLTNFHDNFSQGSSGSPSLITVCITDMIGVVLWLVIFTPVQTLALDLAKAVVATTLGGGYSSRIGGSDSTLLCMSIVSATHLYRHKEKARNSWFDKWLPSLGDSDDSPVTASASLSTARTISRGVKNFIALHILIQGLCRMVRRWYIKREYAQAAPITKKSDPDGISGAQTHSEGSVAADSSHYPSHSSTESSSKTSLQSLRSGQDRISSGKKKRKQGNYVRSQQPLWAAFAATKVTMIREFEQSQAKKNDEGSNATDAKNLGCAPFSNEEGRIWVTLVQPTNLYFDTSMFRTKSIPGAQKGEIEETGVDRSKPFYVRVNGADWASCKIQATGEESSDSGKKWTCEVYGLSPAYTYHCSFVRCEDDVVIYSAKIATPSSPIIDQPSSASTPPQHQNLRPSSPTSPITTLKKSIAAFEASVNESSSQLRRLRKDNKASASAVKKEIDLLNERLNRTGAMERTLQTRQAQQTQHMRQADDAISSITNELEEIGKLPEDDSFEWKQTKTAWEDEKTKYSGVRESLSQLKEDNHRDISSIQNEALSAQQKRERLQHRTAKLSSQHERLESSTSQGLSEKDSQYAEQAAKILEREQFDRAFNIQATNLVRKIQETQYHCRLVWQQSQLLETAYEQQQIMASHSPFNGSRPITPEGDLPGTQPHSASSNALRFPNFGSPDAHPLLNGNFASPRLDNFRNRSTSMLSGNSIYTDFSDADPAPPMPTANMVEEMRKHSASSGSAGGSSPMSPIPVVRGMEKRWSGAQF